MNSPQKVLIFADRQRITKGQTAGVADFKYEFERGAERLSQIHTRIKQSRQTVFMLLAELTEAVALFEWAVQHEF